MALIKCSSCGAEISDAAQNCPQCGAPNINRKPMSPSDSLNSIQGNTSERNLTSKESSVLGILSAILSGLYLIFRVGMSIAYRMVNLRQLYYYEDILTKFSTADNIVTCILSLGIICTWIISYKKEKCQTPRMISTVLIAVIPLVYIILNIILDYIFRIM